MGAYAASMCDNQNSFGQLRRRNKKTEGQAMVVLSIFLALLGLGVIGLLVALVASLPDIRRYLAMSRM